MTAKIKEQYENFIAQKIIDTPKSGFEVSKTDIHPALYPHQNDIVQWSLLGGRRAIFASFGLGKSIMQLEIARQVTIRENQPFLIVTDLGIKQEFVRDGKIIGVDVRYITSDAEFEKLKGETSVFITNYERVRNGSFDCSKFVGVSLDEAAVLRDRSTETYLQFTPLFRNTKYRFVATATPSPNRYEELINYAAWLGIMDVGQSKTRFFQRDSTKADNLTIFPHKKDEFMFWLSSWAIFLQRPSDLGYSDEGYDLPPMQVFEHFVKLEDLPEVLNKNTGQFAMYREAGMSLIDASKEKRESIYPRLKKTVEIINDSPDEHCLIWHHLEAERVAIEKAIPEAKTIFGKQDNDTKEWLLIQFTEGEYPILATKPEIAGAGVNFQKHCSTAIFMGVNHSFHDIIQAIHRIYRFMQKKEVKIHFVITEAEASIWKNIQRKWKEYDQLMLEMRELIQEYGLAKNALSELQRGITVNRQEAKGEYYKVINNDCVEELMTMQDNSVDCIITSIPFANQYEYTPHYKDFGHTDNIPHFFQQMDFLIQELHRVLAPGRRCCIHVKDRIIFGNINGTSRPTVEPFHMHTAFAFMKHGFNYDGMITVTTDVVRENNQTYRLGYGQNCKDSTKMSVGLSEYVLLFCKTPSDTSNGYADTPVEKDPSKYSLGRWQLDAHSLWRSSGNRDLIPNDFKGWDKSKIMRWWKHYTSNNVYDFQEHLRISQMLEDAGVLSKTFMTLDPAINTETVWSDVTRIRTLNTEQKRKNQEQHLCPLQFDIVERLIERYTTKDEIVFDPFTGIGTVPKLAVEMGRYGLGTELNPDYWKAAKQYCYEAEYKHRSKMPTLFDVIDFEKQEA